MSLIISLLVQPVISDWGCGKGLHASASQARKQAHQYQESACHMRQ